MQPVAYHHRSAMNRRALILATVSFAVSLAAWGLIGALAPIFSDLYQLSAVKTAGAPPSGPALSCSRGI